MTDQPSAVVATLAALDKYEHERKITDVENRIDEAFDALSDAYSNTDDYERVFAELQDIYGIVGAELEDLSGPGYLIETLDTVYARLQDIQEAFGRVVGT